MKKLFGENLRIALLTILIGIGVAITYFYFEAAVRHSISYVWDDLLDTENHRLVVVPVCVCMALVYFGAQHLFDPKAERQESHGLGSAPSPTVLNFIKVLVIGFLSLLAGASLGPEAILVPACVLLGSYIGTKLLGRNKATANLFGMAGFIALFAAFFNSFLVGLLALLLIKKQFKININPRLIIVAIIASGSTTLTLGLLKSSAYVAIPGYSWHLNIGSIFMLAALYVAGYCMTYILNAAHEVCESVIKLAGERPWWSRALIAGIGLSALYLLGGQLVQFTGNESIIPMLKQSTDLGFWGLIWLLFIKLLAISWSKVSGYRGGLVFPTIFTASVLVAISQLFTHDLNFIYGLLVVMVGAIVADAKVKVLF